MTLPQIKEQIKAFGSKKIALMQEYLEKKEQLTKKVKAGDMYQSELDKRLADFDKEGREYSRKTSAKLYADIEAEYEKELEALRAMEKGVTADDVAELTLLEGMKITADELKNYYEKYKHKPLALKKLGQIADKKVLEDPSVTFGFNPVDVKGELESLVGVFKRDTNYIEANFNIAATPETLAHAETVQYSTERTLDSYLANYQENRK